ncbi:MAG: type I methionyl aminopeptidase, partial [Moorea sp. SIO3B2]|nr:type I methionyl aminopeptidase [Moorena sp. SIO3B2]
MNILSNLLSGVTNPSNPSRPKKKRRRIEIKSEREIEIMRQAATIVATVLKEISEMVEPGMSTA